MSDDNIAMIVRGHDLVQKFLAGQPYFVCTDCEEPWFAMDDIDDECPV